MGTIDSIDNPTTTMEDLFLNIVRESERRPGARRVSSGSMSQRLKQESAADDTATRRFLVIL